VLRFISTSSPISLVAATLISVLEDLKVLVFSKTSTRLSQKNKNEMKMDKVTIFYLVTLSIAKIELYSVYRR